MPKKSKKNSSVKKKNSKEKDSLFVLKIVFIALFIFVIILMPFAVSKRIKEKKKLNADMVVPILENNAKAGFMIDLEEFKKSDRDNYIFKVTNYRKDIMAGEDIKYSIIIQNPTACKISLIRGNSDTDLIKEQKETIIDSLKLYKDKKQDVYYKVNISKNCNVKKKDFVTIVISA